MTELNAAEQARARGRVYGILARLVLEGLDAEGLEQLRALDGWLLSEGEGAVELDEVAAEHHACFHLGVFPYAGAFLDPSAKAGAWSDRVRAHYDRAGFRPRLDELAADHLGVELAFASFVTAAIAEAVEDARPTVARRLEALLAEFLDACLLSWLPALVVAGDDLEAAGTFWPRVLAATLEFAAEHRLGLEDRAPRRAPVELAEPEDLLADERTGLRRIAEQLLTPAASGLFLTRADIARLGRDHALPRGFGSRLIMLDNLLRSAVDYGELPALLEALDALLVERDHGLATLAAGLELEQAVAPWRGALRRTRALARTLAASTPPSSKGLQSPWTSKPSTTTPPAR